MSGAMAQLGGGWVCHVTVLPGQSRENLSNPPSAHLYFSAGGVAGVSLLSLSQLWANRRLCRAGNPTNQNGRDLSYFPTFFTYSRFSYRHIHFIKKRLKKKRLLRCYLRNTYNRNTLFTDTFFSFR
jgi:hypothetical protein